MKHAHISPDFDHRSIAATDAQIREYIASGPTWLTVSEVRNSAHLMKEVAARIYAGRNPMAHHGKPIRLSGMGGALQVMSRLATRETMKFRAGQWLVLARLNRARGNLDLARQALMQASRDRLMASGAA